MNIKTLMMLAIIMFSLNNFVLAAPTLSKNSTGNDVLTLQKKLYLVGYEITEFDGVFGEETAKAVSAFQRDKNLTVTGVVTSSTWRALKNTKPIKGRKLPQIAPIKPKTSGGTYKVDNTLVPYGKTFINSKQGAQIVATGKKYLGVPYVFGGTTPKGFDCSGFLQYVFRENGFNIPRLADEQYKLGRSAQTSQLQAGDLVFFTTYEPGPSHCGIYVGSGNFMHASSSKGIRVDSLSNEYWRPRFLGGKKIIE